MFGPVSARFVHERNARTLLVYVRQPPTISGTERKNATAELIEQVLFMFMNYCTTVLDYSTEINPRSH